MATSERLSKERIAERRQAWLDVAVAAQDLMPGDIAREIVEYLDALESAYAQLDRARELQHPVCGRCHSEDRSLDAFFRCSTCYANLRERSARFEKQLAEVEKERDEAIAALEYSRDAIRAAVDGENEARAEVERLIAALKEIAGRGSGKWCTYCTPIAEEALDLDQKLTTDERKEALSDK